jgi:hypothetical protein
MTTIEEQIKEGQKRWSEGINTQSEGVGKEEINEFVKFKLLEYGDCRLVDDDLWEVYQDDFKTFTTQTFKECNQISIRNLRQLLRVRGVWVRKHRNATVPESLFQTLQEDDPTEWTETEIREHMEAGGEFSSGRIQYMLNNNGFTSSTRLITPMTSATNASLTVPPINLTTPPITPAIEPEPTPEPTPATPIIGSTTPATTVQARDLDRQTQSLQGPGISRELTTLDKIYTDERKYSGENDNFDFKLVIFHDLCRKAGVTEELKPMAYSTMLTGLALDHFYANLKNAIQTIPFSQMCDATRNYFEGPEYKRSILSKWNSTTLRSVMDRNTGKPTRDCLQLLIKELRHLQHGLAQNLQTDDFLHNKLILACQNMPACQYACFKPADSLAGLINDLQASIATYESSHESTQAFFTDRRFHRQRPRLPPPTPPPLWIPVSG